jgi:hypothetical protein
MIDWKVHGSARLFFNVLSHHMPRENEKLAKISSRIVDVLKQI